MKCASCRADIPEDEEQKFYLVEDLLEDGEVVDCIEVECFCIKCGTAFRDSKKGGE